MFDFFKKKKLRADVEELEKQILEKLKMAFPDVAEKHQHWKISMFIIQDNPRQIQLLHQTSDIEYDKLNKKKHQKNFD